MTWGALEGPPKPPALRDAAKPRRSASAVFKYGLLGRAAAGRQLAGEALLQERQKSMVQASATTIGLPDLRAGQLVEILGLGSRFSGIYFITDTTHTIGDGGYTTQFNCRREDPGKGGGT